MPESPAWLLGRGYWSELYSVPPLQCDAGVSCLAARQRLGLSCIPSLLCSVMPESPAWLLGRGYWSELCRLLEKIARVNGHPTNVTFLTDQLQVRVAQGDTIYNFIEQICFIVDPQLVEICCHSHKIKGIWLCLVLKAREHLGVTEDRVQDNWRIKEYL